MDLTAALIRNDLLLQFVGRAECSVQSLCAKISFLLIFRDKSRSFIGEYYGRNPRQSILLQRLHSPKVHDALRSIRGNAEITEISIDWRRSIRRRSDAVLPGQINKDVDLRPEAVDEAFLADR